MVIKVFSDCHGYLPNISSEFDLLLIAGDITPAKWGYGGKLIQWEWLTTTFRDWLNTLPFKTLNSKVYLIPGNHDKVFENITDTERLELKQILGHHFELLIHEEKTFEYLNDNDVQKIKIFGTPYCKMFGSWSFMKYDSFLETAFAEIPENLDILITHDPPALNGMGKITQGRQIGKEAGNEILAKYVLEKKPKYVFSGHIHSGNHKFEEYEGIKMANVSHVDESYTPVYGVLTFEL